MIWRHLLGYLPANIVSGLVSFAIVYAFTRLLDPADFGRQALVLSGMFIIQQLVMTWSEAAAFRFAGEAAERGDMADHVRTALGFSCLSSVPAVGLVAIAWMATGYDPRLQAAVGWLAVALPAMTFVQTSRELRRARSEIARFSAITILYLLTALAVSVGAETVFDTGPSSLYIGYALSGLLFAAVEGVSLWRESRGGRVRPERLGAALRYGLPVGVSLLLELALSAGDRFMIAAYLDQASVGVYAAGYGVADQTVRLLCMWGAMAGAPLMMQAYDARGPDGVREAGAGLARMLMLAAFPAAAGIALVARPLSDFMIGEDLRAQAARIMPWIAGAGLMNGLVIYYFAEAFQLRKRTFLRAGLMVIPVVLNIVLNMILLPRVGLMGAVYATVASYAAALAIMGVAARRLLPMPVPLVDLAKVAAACLVMAGVVALLPDIGGLPELVLKAGCGAAGFALSAVALNAAGARAMAQSLVRRNAA